MHLCTCSLRRESILHGWRTPGPAPRPRAYCEDFAACPDGRGEQPPSVPAASSPHRPLRAFRSQGATPADQPDPAHRGRTGSVPPRDPGRPGYALPAWARTLEPGPRRWHRPRPSRPTRPGYFSYDEYVHLRDHLRRLAAG